ncbi:MAG: hypothetical protein IBX67_08190 [Dehalococcoidia bacterium]|nr:hypothetical protein [Dehalococcoidia bacterium]
MKEDLGNTKPLRRGLVMMGIMGLFLLGHVLLSGPLSGAPIPDGATPAVEQAKEDLAARKGIDKEQITVVSVKAVNWPDSSLGCPQPDMFYAQVITPGYRIVLSWGGRAYEFHSDLGGRVVYCGQ